MNSGYDTFYGLNGPAFVLLSLGYGITDNLSASFAHASLHHEYEFSLLWLILNQGEGLTRPVFMSVVAGGRWITQKVPGGKVFRSKNMKVNLQISISRELTHSFSALLVPAYSSNTKYQESSEEGTVGLGTGGRWRVADLSFIGEWVPVLSGYQANAYGWGAGLEYKIGGHVFQVFITNGFGLTSDLFLPGGDLKLSEGEFRLGFNIFRTF